MARLPASATAPDIGLLILTVRGYRVILDSDLARIYGVPTFRFNEAVKRNVHRFPKDFRFQLTKEEWVAVRSLRSQTTILQGGELLTSQIAISKKGRGGRRTRPSVFTEHGALMAANVLNSEGAVEMSIYVIRAFVSMRRELARHRDLARRLAEIEKTLIGHDAALRDLYDKIRTLLLPPAAAKPREIGFHVKEAAACYQRHAVRGV